MAIAAQAKNLVTEVDEEAVQAFETNGFLGVRDLLTPEEVADFLRCVKELEAQVASGSSPHLVRQGDQYTQHVNVWRTNENIRRHVFNPKLAELARRLGRTRRLRLWHDQAIIKMPGGQPTACHQDLPAWPMIEAWTFSVWIALVDASVETGCLQYIPGAHKWGRLAHTTLPREMLQRVDGLRYLVPDDKVDQLTPVPMELTAGSATFHHSLMLHYAGPNRSSSPRYGFIVNYMPDGVRFSGRPHPVTDGLKLAVYQPIEGESFPILASEDASEMATP